jgi:hypothetical protein
MRHDVRAIFFQGKGRRDGKVKGRQSSCFTCHSQNAPNDRRALLTERYDVGGVAGVIEILKREAWCRRGFGGVVLAEVVDWPALASSRGGELVPTRLRSMMNSNSL